MKKKLSLLLIVLLLLSAFAGCKKNQKDVGSPTSLEETEQESAIIEETEELQTDSEGNPIDNDSAEQVNGKVVNSNNNTSGESGGAKQGNVATSQPVTNNCTISISCSQVLSNMERVPDNKKGIIPSSGMFLGATSVEIQNGDSAYDILVRITRQRGIHLDSTYTAMYGSSYIKGIGNLYEFDCGGNSGWLYMVNGSTPSLGSSQYKVKSGDNIVFYYKVG